jgi:hypothetical protein
MHLYFFQKFKRRVQAKDWLQFDKYSGRVQALDVNEFCLGEKA